MIRGYPHLWNKTDRGREYLYSTGNRLDARGKMGCVGMWYVIRFVSWALCVWMISVTLSMGVLRIIGIH